MIRLQPCKLVCLECRGAKPQCGSIFFDHPRRSMWPGLVGTCVRFTLGGLLCFEVVRQRLFDCRSLPKLLWRQSGLGFIQSRQCHSVYLGTRGRLHVTCRLILKSQSQCVPRLSYAVTAMKRHTQRHRGGDDLASAASSARMEKFLSIARQRQRGLIVVLEDPDRQGVS